MSASTKDFYDKIHAFRQFGDVVTSSVYTDVPADWSVVITDIKGSTQAISENRYKDVNMLGASSIAAVLNALKGKKIPYVFGGDGATFLVHDDDLKVVSEALAATQALAQASFGFELRAGAVPVRDLNERSGRVQVAKFGVTETLALAMITGGGVAMAEGLIKSSEHGPRYELKQKALGLADVSGLSCRWQPVPAKKGEMLSLLVLARGSADQARETYSRLITELDQILGEESGKPVTFAQLNRKPTRYSLKKIWTEIKIKTNGRPLKEKFKVVMKVVFETLLVVLTFPFHAKIGGFDSLKYVKSVASHSDFRKFDDMLRMIVDCSAEQQAQIEKLLREEREQGKIAYGIHAAKQALMTCLVFNLEDHVHFIDGDGGGYAFAAQQLKKQLAEA